MGNYRNHLALRNVFVKVVSSHQFYLILLINEHFYKCDKYGITIDDKSCCGGLFANKIVLCAPTKSQLKKLLRFSSRWSRNYEI